MLAELQKLLCSGAIRRHQLGKNTFCPNIINICFSENEYKKVKMSGIASRTFLT